MALRTVHPSAEITERLFPRNILRNLVGTDSVTNEARQGILNPTLFCLGVA